MATPPACFPAASWKKPLTIRWPSNTSVPLCALWVNAYPDHDTLNRFHKEIEGLFVELLVLAEAMGLLKLGTVSLDGTKPVLSEAEGIKANASTHKALSWDYANPLEAQFKQEVETLMRLAEAADNTLLPEDLDVPQELKRRQDRLAVIANTHRAQGPSRKSRPARRHVMCQKKPSMMKNWPNVKNTWAKPARKWAAKRPKRLPKRPKPKTKSV